MKGIEFINGNKTVFSIFLYVLFFSSLYINNGIYLDGESSKYYNIAREVDFISFFKHLANKPFFASYILYLKLLFVVTGDNFFCGVIANLILVFITSCLFYKCIILLNENKKAAFIGQVSFLLFYPIQFWVLSLYSEIFFIFILMFTLYCFIKRDNANPVYFFLLAGFLVFSRPQGLFFTAFFLVLITSERLRLSTKKLVFSSGMTFLILVLVLVSYPFDVKSIKDIFYMEPIIRSNHNIIIPFHQKTSLIEVYAHLIQQNGFFQILVLAMKKMIIFFIYLRPYYSLINNVVMFIFNIYALFGFILLIRQAWIYKDKLRIQYLFIIMSNVFLVGIFYNDWHNRLNLLILPFIIINNSVFISKYIDGKKLE